MIIKENKQTTLLNMFLIGGKNFGHLQFINILTMQVTKINKNNT